MLKRDFGVLLLSVCALFLSLQHEGAYQFRKAWYHQFSEHEAFDRELFEHPQPVPPPLVTDLNGDGKPEIITATPSGKLHILAPRRFGDGFAKAELISQVELGSGRIRVAALASGFLTPPPKELVRAPRKQVVVVVTSELRVMCLDHNLKQMWEHDLSSHYPPHGGLRELAIHISDQHISQGGHRAGAGGGMQQQQQQKQHEGGLEDRGIVVVGASVIPLTLAQREQLENELEEEVREALLARFKAHGRRGGAADQERAELQQESRHFSYFGFEGSRGPLRWMHEAKDFHRNLGELQDQLVAQHAFHMAAEETEGRHYGEASCREYRASVLAALPHSWHSPLDTALVPAHFEKQRVGSGAQKQQLSKMGALKAKGQGAAAAGGAQQQQQHGGAVGGGARKPGTPGAKGAVGNVVSAVVKGATKGGGPRGSRRRRQPELPPNVVVAHLEEGIEAIHLFSGRTVCRLHLPTPGLHVDLNGDGVPEHIVAAGGDMETLLEEGDTGHKHNAFCYMSVSSGIPARLRLFNGTICRPFHRHYLRRTGNIGPIQVAPPIMLPQPGKHGQYRSGLGQKGLAVFLNSLGELTAYDSDGDMLWQHSVGTTWAEPDDEDVPAPAPTLRAMPLRPRAVPSVILAGGQDSATVVSEQGREVDTFELPDMPAMPLQLADFNFDGYTDVMMVSQDGIWGWAQVRHPGALPFSALVAALMIIMAAVFVTQQGFMQGGGGAGCKRRPLRSTERED